MRGLIHWFLVPCNTVNGKKADLIKMAMFTQPRPRYNVDTPEGFYYYEMGEKSDKRDRAKANCTKVRGAREKPDQAKAA